MNLLASLETKVKAQAITAAVTGLLTWALTTYVPAFHHGLPAPVANVLPMAVGALLGLVAGYRAPHTHLRPAPAGPVTITPAAPPSTATGPVKP